jgi:hypothetical protein
MRLSAASSSYTLQFERSFACTISIVTMRLVLPLSSIVSEEIVKQARREFTTCTRFLR